MIVSMCDDVTCKPYITNGPLYSRHRCAKSCASRNTTQTDCVNYCFWPSVFSITGSSAKENGILDLKHYDDSKLRLLYQWTFDTTKPFVETSRRTSIFLFSWCKKWFHEEESFRSGRASKDLTTLLFGLERSKRVSLPNNNGSVLESLN